MSRGTRNVVTFLLTLSADDRLPPPLLLLCEGLYIWVKLLSASGQCARHQQEDWARAGIVLFVFLFVYQSAPVNVYLQERRNGTSRACVAKLMKESRNDLAGKVDWVDGRWNQCLALRKKILLGFVYLGACWLFVLSHNTQMYFNFLLLLFPGEGELMQVAPALWLPSPSARGFIG